ncbi:MAG: hypothetical protein H6624_19040 [Bdellovibrionaceae bacterium]|nr:hypothetical protein [Bdellovibrionales bacterium]MCB9086444.1 hypothetical protein [Pseudobdellovibrionaceae bacterium]
MKVRQLLSFQTPLANQRGVSTLAMAMATVIILGTGVSLMMSDIQMSSKTRSKLRLSLQAYTMMEQFAVRFNGAFELRNPSWFVISPPTVACPTAPGPINSVAQGAAPTPPYPPGSQYCAWPAQPCPLGTTQVNIDAGLNAICVTNDIDGNAASANFCIRSTNGSDYCLDTTGVISKNEYDADGTAIPTLEMNIKDVTPIHKKIKNQAVAIWDQLLESAQPALEKAVPYTGYPEKAYAQLGVEAFLDARPNKPAIGATTNTANVPACADAPGGPDFCVRCADPNISCIQIKMCMPPGCGAFGGGTSQVLYQRIAILRAPP